MRGDVFWESVYRAYRQGLIDIPFAPHGMNANRLLTVRDRHNSIRVQQPGNVPMRKEDLERESELLEAERPVSGGFADQMVRDVNIMI